MILPLLGNLTAPILRPLVASLREASGTMIGDFNIATLFAGGVKGLAYDFTDKSKLFQNSNGTGSVTADNDPIGYVTDLSGNGKHGIQATAGSRPLWTAADAAVFNGSRSLAAASVDLTSTGKATVIVCYQTSLSSTQGIMNHGSFSAGDFEMIMSSASVAGGAVGTTMRGASANPATTNPRSKPSASFVVACVQLDHSGSGLTAVKSRVNGELNGSQIITSGSSGTAAFGNKTTTIGNWYGGTGLNGKIARILVIGRELNAAELYQAERWAGQGGGLSLITELPPPGEVDYMMLDSYGQSLSLGVSSTPVLSGTRRFSQDFMLSGGTEPWSPSTNYTSLVPLSEDVKVISESNCGESPLSGMVELLHENGYPNNTISAVTGFPSLTIAQLSLGQTSYNTKKAVITAAMRRAREQFKHFKMRAFTWMQGEADGGNATYAASLNTLRNDLNTDVKAITGQTENIWCLSYQLPRAQIGLAHLAAQENYSNIVIAAPIYQFPTADGVHLTNTSSKVMGAYFGLAYKRVVVDGDTSWKPLMATGSAVAGANIDLTYNKSGLTFDTTIVSAQSNQGFRVVDSGGTPLTISSVSILNTNTVRITLSASVPAGAKVYYGFSDPTNHTAGTDKGNLRDSQGSTIVFDGGGINYAMHNWAVLQQVNLP